jgi:hypothetical protein
MLVRTRFARVYLYCIACFQRIVCVGRTWVAHTEIRRGEVVCQAFAAAGLPPCAELSTCAGNTAYPISTVVLARWAVFAHFADRNVVVVLPGGARTAAGLPPCAEFPTCAIDTAYPISTVVLTRWAFYALCADGNVVVVTTGGARFALSIGSCRWVIENHLALSTVLVGSTHPIPGCRWRRCLPLGGPAYGHLVATFTATFSRKCGATDARGARAA